MERPQHITESNRNEDTESLTISKFYDLCNVICTPSGKLMQDFTRSETSVYLLLLKDTYMYNLLISLSSITGLAQEPVTWYCSTGTKFKQMILINKQINRNDLHVPIPKRLFSFFLYNLRFDFMTVLEDPCKGDLI